MLFKQDFMHNIIEYTDAIHFWLIALFIALLGGKPDVETSALEIISPPPKNMKEGHSDSCENLSLISESRCSW
jgi:hypothetical protein